MARSLKVSPLTYDIGWRLKTLHKHSSDPYVRIYKGFKQRGTPSYVEDTLAIFNTGKMKLFIECMLLSGFEYCECVDFFGCSVKAIEFYEKMFFDVGPVRNSTARLLMIADEGHDNEKWLKLSAVKFGKDFIRWYIGLDKTLNKGFLLKMRGRLTDGVLLKALGHEYSGNSEMTMYLKMISAVKESIPKGSDKENKSIEMIADHFSKILKNRNK